MAERIRVTFDTDLKRRRLGVVLRVVSAIPAAFILLVWSLVALAALVPAWLISLVRGKVPRPLHRLLRAYVRYGTRFSAWLNLVSRPYPRVRRAHPVDVIAPPELQRRLLVLLRPVLALPALVLASVLGVVLGAAAVAGWFVALVRGRTTEGLRELGAFCVRYQAETVAYLLLVTPRSPRLEPPTSER